MEPTITVLKLTLLIMFCGFLLIIGYLSWETIKERRADALQTFSIMYQNIQCIIRTWPVNEKNRTHLIQYFSQLRACKHKNKEKYSVLWGEFCDKYKPLSDEILSQDEFSCDNVFTEYR